MEMIFLVCLLGWLWETDALSVTGVLGEDITIQCSHSYAFNNIKYFCKERCKEEDILISSKEKNGNSSEKYSISDEGNTFYVTISHLTEDDSGTYRCGIERIGLDTYTKVVLTVKEGSTKKPVNDLPQSNSNEASETTASFSKRLMYIGAGLSVVILALIIAVFMFFRHQRYFRISSGKVHDTIHAPPSHPKQDEHHVTSSTPSEDQEIDSRTICVFSSASIQHQDTSRYDGDYIYSNISFSSGSQIPPDSPWYSTISFDKHTDCSTVPSTVTYSTIN